MYTPGTIANSQRTPTKIKTMLLLPKKEFSGTSDTIRHLKTFRIISNEMLVLLLIFMLLMCVSFLQMYSEKFNVYFYEQMFF